MDVGKKTNMKCWKCNKSLKYTETKTFNDFFSNDTSKKLATVSEQPPLCLQSFYNFKYMS